MKRYVYVGLLFFASFSLQGQDWANLNRYQEANKELGEKVSSRVVFMGNSITEGWSHFRPEFFKQNNFINRGISGQTTPQMLLRFRQDVIDIEADIVVILAGINDIAGNTGVTTNQQIVNNIKGMIELAQANNIKVVLCTVLPANKFSWKKEINPVPRVLDLNERLKSIAVHYRLPFIDYFSAMTDTENGLPLDLSPDGVHPNKKGYGIMEPLVLATISKVLH